MAPPLNFKKRFHYTLDNLYSQGTGAMVLSLGLLSLLIILVSAVILVYTRLAPGQETPLNFQEAFWLSLLRTLGSGSIGGRETVWGFRFLMLGVTLGSIFVFSSLIGVLTNGMQNRLEELRKGRSEVIETGHTVILGWSEQIFTIVKELILASASEPRSCLVVLAPREKVVMEADLRQKVGSTGRTRLVCRTGNPMEMNDLKIASLNTARSIIVLSQESSNPDADVFKVILAILNHPERRKEPYHIVASLLNPRNTAVARVIGGREVSWITMGDTIARIIAQTSRQSGLSIVYTELMDFKQNEIYFHEEPVLVGKTYGEALTASEESALIGVLPKGENPKLNPPVETVIHPGDQLIVIAKDNNSIAFDLEGTAAIRKELIEHQSPSTTQKKCTLILGWNWRGTKVIHELDNYVATGSEVLVVADRQGTLDSLEQDCLDLQNQTVCFRYGDTTDRQLLEDLGLEKFNHVIILCYSDRLAVQQADAQTLITLLHLRDIADKKDLKFSIVSEMLDVRNRKLATVTRADDFIVSDRLISLIMAQVSENRNLNTVFEELFDPNTAEIYLKPVRNYIRIGQETDFFTIVVSARHQNETAIGYRSAAYAKDPQHNYGVVINPLKSARITFHEQDHVIVLANS